MSLGRRFAVITAGEYGRMVKESAFDEILLLNEVREQAGKRFKLPKNQQPELHQMVLHLAETHGIPSFRVGSRFPAGLARKLRDAGMILEIADENGLFPERQIKTAAEVEALRKGNRASEAGFRGQDRTEEGLRMIPEIGFSGAGRIDRTIGIRDGFIGDNDSGRVAHEFSGGIHQLAIHGIEWRKDRENRVVVVHAVHAQVIPADEFLGGRCKGQREKEK